VRQSGLSTRPLSDLPLSDLLLSDLPLSTLLLSIRPRLGAPGATAAPNGPEAGPPVGVADRPGT
jgi:hypothetical protein